MTRFILVGLLAVCGANAGDRVEVPEGFIVVAHRGVVDDTLTENGLPSLEETIRRGYTHIEVDVQCTKDGQAVCCHGTSVGRTAGVRRKVGEVTLAELRELVSEETVPSFKTFCGRCEGRINVMPDVKACPPHLRDAFVASIESALTEHGLMRDALFIGRGDLTRHFAGKGKLAWGAPLEAARRSARGKQRPGESYFIFKHAADLDETQVKGFHEMGLLVIVSINTFHYLGKGDLVELGREDVRKMVALGVDGLQIDSVYDDLVLPASADKPTD